MKTMNYNLRISIMGVGQVFGEHDVLGERNHCSTSVTCVSNTGNVFCIKVEDFLKRFKMGSDSRKILASMAIVKEKAIKDKINGNAHII